MAFPFYAVTNCATAMLSSAFVWITAAGSARESPGRGPRIPGKPKQAWSSLPKRIFGGWKRASRRRFFLGWIGEAAHASVIASLERVMCSFKFPPPDGPAEQEDQAREIRSRRYVWS